MANEGRRKYGAGQVLVRVGKNGRTRAIRYRVMAARLGDARLGRGVGRDAGRGGP